MKLLLRIGILLTLLSGVYKIEAQVPQFRALVLTERGGWHEGFVVEALKWLDIQAVNDHFEYTVINHADEINRDLLSHYQIFIQLNYPPYMWSDSAKTAFVSFMESGKIGWVGFHHASLLGEFDGYAMWDWFSDFLGGIRFQGYIAATASGTVVTEDKQHPVMKGVPPDFTIPDDEWYTFESNPRPRVHVLAHVDEYSYQPASDIKMGDHPVIWVNEKLKARNVYFLMGHHANLMSSDAFKTMFHNAILWTAKQ